MLEELVELDLVAVEAFELEVVVFLVEVAAFVVEEDDFLVELAALVVEDDFVDEAAFVDTLQEDEDVVDTFLAVVPAAHELVALFALCLLAGKWRASWNAASERADTSCLDFAAAMSSSSSSCFADGLNWAAFSSISL